MSEPLAITEVGMVTALGLGATASSAAARAGIVRASALEDYAAFDETTGALADVAGHAVRRVGAGFAGFGRTFRLASAALTDLTRSAGPLAGGGRGGLFVALSGRFFERAAVAAEVAEFEEGKEILADWDTEEAERRERYRSRLVPRLAAATGLTFDAGRSQLNFEGAPGFGSAVNAAKSCLESRELDWAIVGGVDSLLDAETVAALDVTGVLKSVDNPAGMMPGEAAAFVLLESPERAGARGAKVRATLRAAAVESEGRDRFTDPPSTGAAISRVVRACVGGRGKGPEGVGMVCANLCGDTWRAGAWGTALTRVPRPIREARTWYPAVAFGEIGAATGPVATCVGVHAVARGWTARSDFLVVLIGDDGVAACLDLDFTARNGEEVLVARR